MFKVIWPLILNLCFLCISGSVQAQFMVDHDRKITHMFNQHRWLTAVDNHMTLVDNSSSLLIYGASGVFAAGRSFVGFVNTDGVFTSGNTTICLAVSEGINVYDGFSRIFINIGDIAKIDNRSLVDVAIGDVAFIEGQARIGVLIGEISYMSQGAHIFLQIGGNSRRLKTKNISFIINRHLIADRLDWFSLMGSESERRNIESNWDYTLSEMF